MLTQEQIIEMKNVNIQNTDKSKLVDVSGLIFDYELSREDRMKWIVKNIHNPFCFRYGDIGVKIEYMDNGPSLQDVFLDFLIRKKSGL